MERQYIKVKEWFYDKMCIEAQRYNVYIDCRRTMDIARTALVEDGYVTLVGTILQESEKALKVKFESGEVVGSCKGWTAWTPKSIVAQQQLQA